MTPEYQAFISYSHAADGRLAPALQRGLQRIGTPWYRRPTVKVFRDATSLSANAALWPEIERQLSRCAWFVLMASPAAAASPWVGREVAWWLQHRDVQRLLIVVSDGELHWDGRRGDVDWTRSNCLPQALRGRFAAEPLYVDLRWARSAEQLSLRHARFRDAVLTLAAPLHGRAKDELDSDEIRQHRRFIVAASAAGGLGLALAMLAGFASWNARQEAARAEASWREAQSRRLATQAVDTLVREQVVDDAMKIALMAWTLAPTGEATAALQRLGEATATMSGILGQHTAGLAALAFSDDSLQLATLGRDGSIQRWRTSDWQAVALLRGGLRNGKGLRFDATGRHLLAWDGAGAAELWDLASSQRLALPAAAADRPAGMGAALSADGAWVALTGQGGEVAVWSRQSGTWRAPPASLAGQRVIGLRFDSGTRLRLALVGTALRIATWDLATGAWSQGPPSEAIHMLAYGDRAGFATGGRRVLVTGDGMATVFDIDAALATRRLASASGVESGRCEGARLDGDGRQLLIGARSAWRLFDLGRAESGPVRQGPIAFLHCAQWSPDLRWRVELAAGSWQADSPGGERLLIWDQASATPGQARRRVDTSCAFRDDASRCVQRLCAQLAPTLDEAQLRQLFGIENSVWRYDRFKAVLGQPLCGSRAP